MTLWGVGGIPPRAWNRSREALTLNPAPGSAPPNSSEGIPSSLTTDAVWFTWFCKYSRNSSTESGGASSISRSMDTKSLIIPLFTSSPAPAAMSSTMLPLVVPVAIPRCGCAWVFFAEGFLSDIFRTLSSTLVFSPTTIWNFFLLSRNFFSHNCTKPETAKIATSCKIASCSLRRTELPLYRYCANIHFGGALTNTSQRHEQPC